MAGSLLGNVSERRKGFFLGALVGFLTASAFALCLASLLVWQVNSSAEIRQYSEGVGPEVEASARSQHGLESSLEDWAKSWRAYDLATKEVIHRSQVQDDRILILNLWATWCAPCLAELPSLEQLAKVLPETDYAVAALTWEPQPKVEKFYRSRQSQSGQPALTNLVLRGPPPFALAGEGLPITLVLDRHGEVVQLHRGAIDWVSEPMIESLLRLQSGEVAQPAK